MPVIDATTAREFLEGIVTAFAVLGGAMAYMSGFRAAQALLLGLPSDALAHGVNEGVALGFLAGSPCAIAALMIMTWT
jgi:ABC-type Mn2+/Zn2+ transport system permease subunit